MKYFTDEKYNDNTAWPDYQAYCESIWLKLPPDLQLIQKGMLPESMLDNHDSLSLHDAKITGFNILSDKNQLHISVNTDDDGKLRKAELIYIDFEVLQDVSPERKGEAMKDYESDIMCHEIELTNKKNIDTECYFAVEKN